jgi:hypothetical protein
MRSTAVAAASIALSALSIDVARAEGFNLGDWRRQAEALVQSLIDGGQRTDREIIVPSANIDPKMALVPSPQGRMRIIVPPREAGGPP